MVVYHVHDDAQTVLMQSVDHLLGFDDTRGRIARVRGIRSFRHVVVLRVIPPVVVVIVQCLGLVNARVVEHRLDLHVGDAQLLEVVKTGRLALGVGGAFLHNTQVLAAIGFGHAGIGVHRQITDMGFCDHRIGRRTEGRHAVEVLDGLLRVGQHHGTLAVDYGSGRIRIRRIVHRAVGEGEAILVGGILEIPVHRFAPHALVTLGHRRGIVLLGVRARVGLVDDQVHAGGGRGPHLEGGLGLGPRGSKIIAVIGVGLVEVVSAHDGTGNRSGGTDLVALVVADGHGVRAVHSESVLRGHGYGCLVGLHISDFDGLAVGVGHRSRHIAGRLAAEFDGDLLGIGDFRAAHRNGQGRLCGVDGWVAGDQPDLSLAGLGGGVEHQGVGRDEVVFAIRFLDPGIATVAAQQADVTGSR